MLKSGGSAGGGVADHVSRFGGSGFVLGISGAGGVGHAQGVAGNGVDRGSQSRCS